MNNLPKQQGIGLLNLLVVIVVGVFIGKFAFAVVPMYSENRYVVTGLKELVASGKKLEDTTDAQIKSQMESFYTINNVRSEGPKKIVVVRNAGNVVVKIDYEMRDNFFFNMDLVLRFENHLDSAHPTLCCSPRAEPKSVKY